MGHIFISYSHKDKKYVEKLEQKLIEEGFNVWIDHRIDYGSQWTQAIETAIDNCDAYIVVMSEDAKKSSWVQREMIHAERRKKPFFPLLLSGEFWFSLGNIQFVDLRKSSLPPEKFYKRLEKVTPRRKPAPQPKPAPPKLFIDPKVVARVFGVLTFGIIAMLVSYKLIEFIGKIPFPTPEPTIESTTKVATKTPNVASTPEFRLGSSWARPADGMVMMYVLAGEFQMGSEDGKRDEKPVHTVYLDAFWIDRTEVTNGIYALCVQAGICNKPGGSYFGNSQYEDHPVAYVSWDDANTYCKWAEGRLPTEAEWEKAARGVNERPYPWGEGSDCTLANFYGCIASTTEVGSYEKGKSVFGIYDLAGNVWEWTADWHANWYYDNSPPLNPTGPETGSYRVIRGGSWRSSDNKIHSSYRGWVTPTETGDDIGFRCAHDVIP